MGWVVKDGQRTRALHAMCVEKLHAILPVEMWKRVGVAIGGHDQ